MKFICLNCWASGMVHRRLKEQKVFRSYRIDADGQEPGSNFCEPHSRNMISGELSCIEQRVKMRGLQPINDPLYFTRTWSDAQKLDLPSKCKRSSSGVR